MLQQNNKELYTNTRELYEENGYVVIPNLVPTDLIDKLLTLYKKDVISSSYPFFRQSTNAYQPNKINEFGNVEQSFLDIHDYEKYPEFSTMAKEIFCSDEIQNALRQITGCSSFNLMQTMLFDANTETQPHQDWWYLDSVPNGNLIAAWIALEDIDEKAGRFYIIPKSNKLVFHSDVPNLPHSEWLNRIKIYCDNNQDKIKAPELKKGDVLFWNSRTVHGALPTIDKSFSRKSLTAHYIPTAYNFGNIFTTKDYVVYKTYKGINFYKNQPDYSLLNKIKFGIKVIIYDSPLLLKIMRQVQSRLR